MKTKNEILELNKIGWDKVAEQYFGTTCLPDYGPLAPNEQELHFFKDVKSKKVLEIGCGSGHSLLYLANKGADELWGLDLSTSQIEAAQDLLLEKNKFKANLFISPMEQNPGIPEDYFDMVYSIYALGWTTNLSKTLSNVFTYLKPGGKFIFSWEHPLHNRLLHEDGKFIFAYSYHSEGEIPQELWRGIPAVMITHQRKMSTFINELINAGFTIEKMIEESRILPNDRLEKVGRWYSPERADLVPATLIIKCSK